MRARQRCGRLLVAILASALPAPGLARDPPATYQDLLQLEASRDLGQAADLAKGLTGLDDKQKEHIGKLLEVRLALQRAMLLQAAGLTEEAEQDLIDAKQKLGLPDDLYLILPIQRELNRFAEPDRAEARRQLGLARELLEADKPDQALVRLEPLLATPAPRIDVQAREQARALKVRAEVLKESLATPGVLADAGRKLGAALVVILQWLASFVLLIVAYFGIKWTARMFYRPRGTLVRIEDWTATESEREGKSRELTAEFTNVIRRITTPGGAGELPLLALDSAEVFRPSSIGEVASLNTYVQETDIEIGPIKFNARQLFTWLAGLLRPRFRTTLTGVLSTADGASLTVERRDARGEPVSGAAFSATAAGDGARTEVIRAVAAQVALHLADAAMTNNWRSLHHYLAAEDLLAAKIDPAKRRDNLEAALAQLETSARYDHANWMARLRLAEVLRSLGRPRSSASQYEYLRTRLLDSRVLKDSILFQKFLREQPHFDWILRCNEAVSRTRVGDTGETGKAIAMIRRLVAELPRHDDRRPRADGLRLEMLARSLRAECWTMRLEHDRNDPERKEIVEQIEQDEGWFWDRIPDLARGELDEYADAHMVARNALGRAYYLIGRYRDAVTFLRWALEFHVAAPNLEVKLNLASIYLRRKRRIAALWVEEAKPLLEDVIKLDPQNRKARYLLGKLFGDPAVGDLTKAKEQFRAAGNHALSLFELGHIAIEEGALAEGVTLMRRSIQLRPALDHRQYLITSLLLVHFKTKNDLTRGDLEFALDIAEQLNQASKQGFRDKAQEAIAAFTVLMQKRVEQERAAAAGVEPLADEREDEEDTSKPDAGHEPAPVAGPAPGAVGATESTQTD